MHRLILQAITDFGDSTLLVPAAGLVGIYLWLRGMRQVALVWVTALALCVLATVLLKIGFNACGDRLDGLGIRSPSGHVSLSLTFYGCLALLVGRSLEALGRAIAFGLAFTLVLAITASRLLLHAHTPAEIIAGSLIGILCLAYFWRRSKGSAPIVSDWVAIGAAFTVVGIMTHGHQAATESIIVRLAQYLKTSTQICVATEPGAFGSPDPVLGFAIERPYAGTGVAGAPATSGMSIR